MREDVNMQINTIQLNFAMQSFWS